MKSFILSLMVAAVVSPVASTNTFARQPVADEFPGVHLFAGIAMEKLGLTDAQKVALKETIELYRPELQPLWEKARADRVALRKIIATTPLDQMALESQADQISINQRQLLVVTSRMRADLRSILTRDQLDKIDTWERRVATRAGAFRASVLEWLAQS